jgi:hypothetical protein
LFEASEPARVRGAHVTFEPGARTAWHKISDSIRPFGIAVRSGLHTGEIELKSFVKSWMRTATAAPGKADSSQRKVPRKSRVVLDSFRPKGDDGVVVRPLGSAFAVHRSLASAAQWRGHLRRIADPPLAMRSLTTVRSAVRLRGL